MKAYFHKLYPDAVVMPKSAYVKEHKKLIDTLKSGDRPALLAEAKDQSEELKKELAGGRAGVSKASGFIQRMMAEEKAGITSGKRGFRKFDWKKLANSDQSGKNKHDSDYGASPDILHRFGKQQKLPETLRAKKGRLEAMARHIAKALKEKPEEAKSIIASIVSILNQKQPWTIAHELPKNTIETLQETDGVPPSMVKKLETAEAVQAELPKSEQPKEASGEIPSLLEHFGNLNTDLFGSEEPLKGLEVKRKPPAELGEEEPAATRPPPPPPPAPKQPPLVPEAEKFSLDYDELMEDEFSWLSADRYEKQREMLGYLAENAYRMEDVKLSEITEFLKKKGYKKGVAAATLSEQLNDMKNRLRKLVVEKKDDMKKQKRFVEILDTLKDEKVKSKLKALVKQRDVVKTASAERFFGNPIGIDKNRKKLEVEKEMELWFKEHGIEELLNFMTPIYNAGSEDAYSQLTDLKEVKNKKGEEEDKEVLEFEVINSPILGQETKIRFSRGYHGDGDWGLYGEEDAELWMFSPDKKSEVFVIHQTTGIPLFAWDAEYPKKIEKIEPPKTRKDGKLEYDSDSNPWTQLDAEEVMKENESERPLYVKPPEPQAKIRKVPKGKPLKKDFLQEAKDAGIKVRPRVRFSPKSKNDKIIWEYFKSDENAADYQPSYQYWDLVKLGYDGNDYLDEDGKEPTMYYQQIKNPFIQKMKRFRNLWIDYKLAEDDYQYRKERIEKDVERTQKARQKLEADEEPKKAETKSFTYKDYISSQEKKANRLRELHEQGKSAKEIAEIMKKEGYASVSLSNIYVMLRKLPKKGKGLQMCGE